ncbi:hypothetical protein HPB50_017498 [Hyalomma asiaticum]|uniref:Uncharacterized protein n=1 Tax=Hyalomma asiaticum TaxID=266040 RepID=A0ACB7TJV3_HYAAI|nr:hypothetical protein HPB50_017498 [Hyalomma asiaticum]
MMAAFPYVDIIFGNETEAREFADVHNMKTKDITEIAKLISKFPKENKEFERMVVITQGADDVVVAQGHTTQNFPVPKLEPDVIIDTNGAGDSFVGGVNQVCIVLPQDPLKSKAFVDGFIAGQRRPVGDADVGHHAQMGSQESKMRKSDASKLELQMREQELEQEAARQQRHAASLNDLLVKECQELLALLGQPYVVSPGEAEAQCAWLEQHGLSQGIVTDDSDAWLFGAQCVYRHLFRPDRRPMRYLMKDLTLQFGLDRQKLVAFALLCGSDYTTGVNGVGPVTAMEVISEFKGDDAVSLLEEFRTWLEKAKQEKVQPGSKTRSHLVRLSLEPGFPSSRVAQAYLEPTVDESRETFSWGTPDLDALRTYPFRLVHALSIKSSSWHTQL